MVAQRWPTPLAQLARHAAASRAPCAARPPSFARSLCSTATCTTTQNSASFLRSYRLAVALSLPLGGLALSTLSANKPLECAGDRSYADPSANALAEAAAAVGNGAAATTQEAESILNLRDLGFGTISGICVGVFVKKGLRAAAFTLGFVFIGLQYLSSRSFININWNALTSSYEKLVTTRTGPPAAQGGNRLAQVWYGFIDFVGANVQQRATFVAGIVLGFRLG
ncbi:hypothetical protein JCM8208_005185 [Rhodotorula glutinis]